MSFLYPSLVTGPLLLLIGVPILIHLINMVRQRRVKWAAMQFLVQSQKKYRKWIMLKQLLLVLMRMAALAILLIMLAQPVLRSEWGRLLGGSKTHHIVLLDDSFSMSDRGEDGSALDQGKGFVQQLADKARQQEGLHRMSLLRFSRATEAAETDRFDLLQENLDSAAGVRLEGILGAAAVSQTAAGPVAALEAIRHLPRHAEDETRFVYLVSDFRVNQWGDASEVRAALDRVARGGARIQLVQCVKTARANLAITALRSAGGTVAAGVEMLLQVTVQNFAAAPVRQVAVRLEEDGYSRPAVVLDEIGAGEMATGVFRVKFPTVGQHTVAAALKADTVAADNTRYLALDVPDAAAVLLVDSSRECRDAYYLAAALAPGGSVSTGLRPRIEAPGFLRKHGRLGDFAAIYLLNLDRLENTDIEAVERYVRGGGGVAFFLGERSRGPFFNTKLYRGGRGIFPVPLTVPTDLLANRLEKTADLVVTDHPIFSVFTGARNSFLGSVLVQRYFAVPADWAADADASTRVIAQLRNGAPLVVEKRFGEGRVVAVLSKAAPVETSFGRWNNWARNNPSFVVSMLELQGYLSRQDAAGEARTVGRPLVVTLDPQQVESKVQFTPPSDDATKSILVDAQRQGEAFEAVLADTFVSGIYEAQLRRRDGTLKRGFYAYNVIAREGDLRIVDRPQLAARLKGVPHTLHHASDLRQDTSALAGFNLAGAVLPILIVLLLAEQIVAYLASYHPQSEGLRR